MILVIVAVLGICVFGQKGTIKTERPLRFVPKVTFSTPVRNIERIFVPNSVNGNMAVSPNSKFFLRKVKPSNLWILDLETGEGHHLPMTHDFAYAAYSGDATKVVLYEDVGERKKISVVDLKESRIIAEIKSPTRVDTININFDGSRVATGTVDARLFGKTQNVLRLWDGTDGTVVTEIKGCGGSSHVPPRFSSDGRSVLVDCDALKGKPVKLLSSDTGREVLSLTQDDNYPGPASNLSPDGSTIVSIYRNNGIRVWDAASGKLKGEFVASQGSVNRITFTRDGKLFVTNGFSPVVRTWETHTGEKYRVYETGITKSPSFIVRAVFSESGAMLAGIDKRGRITVWDAKNAGIKFVLNETASKEDFSVNTFFGRGDRILFVRREDAISLIETETGREIQNVSNPTGVYHLNSKGTILVALNSNNSISVWSAE